MIVHYFLIRQLMNASRTELSKVYVFWPPLRSTFGRGKTLAWNFSMA